VYQGGAWDMSVKRTDLRWLGQLKASELHQLAIALGSACSGTKSSVAQGIIQTLDPVSLSEHEATSRASRSAGPDAGLSIVSIDMGIQNLAYAHILVPGIGDKASEKLYGADTVKLPILNAWKRLAVFPSDTPNLPSAKSAKAGHYDPLKYAHAAYHFVDNILQEHKPTHVLIEQQRFRSGGGSAVQEWTIRVGVFEGMLHAILRTLQEERKDKLGLQAVVPINPSRTVRFWLEGRQGVGTVPAKKMTGREGKQAKIEIVGESFMGNGDRLVKTGEGQARSMENAFMNRWCTTSKIPGKPGLRSKKFPDLSASDASNAKVPKLSKLDDLADCLLQGLAWLEWQRLRNLVLQDTAAIDPLAEIRQRLAMPAKNWLEAG
jgi:cruciform cutting endonuclease 1